MGIPGVSIVQEGFVTDAKATGEAYSYPNPPIAVTPHLFASVTAQQARKAVEEIIGDIIRALTEPMPDPKESIVERITTRGPKDDTIEFAGVDYRDCLEKMNEAFLEWGWSDGFPLIPPTEDLVNEMLKGSKRQPNDTVVEKLAPGNARASVKNIAINALMAGCKPGFLPVVITAVEAMSDPAINLRLVSMSTGPHAPLFIVNGPIAERLRINSGLCALGPTGPGKMSFANVVIGRAVRLVLMNVGNSYPGIMDQDTIGSPTKFGMVLAENEKANPWEPYHVERGFPVEESTVSCSYGHTLVELRDLESDSAESLMKLYARRLTGIGELVPHTHKPMILIAPDHARILARDGWKKDDIRQYLYHHCRILAGEYNRTTSIVYPVKKKWLEAADSTSMVPLYEISDFQVVVVGGVAGKSAAYLGVYPANPHLIKA